MDSIDFVKRCFHCVPSWCLLQLSECLLFHGSGEVFAPIYFVFLELFVHGQKRKKLQFLTYWCSGKNNASCAGGGPHPVGTERFGVTNGLWCRRQKKLVEL